MIVITAPTGDIGHQVLEKVVESGAAVRVIARNPSKIPEKILARVEVVEGSHGDREVLETAFSGADTLFWLVSPDPKASSVEEAYVGFSQPAADAIRKHGIKRVVVITALGRGTPQAESAGYVTSSLHMDDLLAATGAAMREVTNPSFMDNIARQADPIREKSMFFGPIDGDKKLPAVATRDIAAVAAELLLDPRWTGRGHVAALGPENLSFNDMAGIISEVIGKEVRYQRISYEDYTAQFTGMGMTKAMARGMTDMARAKNDGLDDAEPRTPESTTPTTFREWCELELKPAFAK
jgi:uncharacterized protein YbjT (DUF2867 family)